MKHLVLLLVAVFVGSQSCGPIPPVTEMDGGSPTDSGSNFPDSGSPDASVDDAGVADAGSPDAGVTDAGTPDAGAPDAGSPDAGPVDAGRPDAGPPDAGPPDAGEWDGGILMLRVMAANLTSGNGQSYDPGHGIRLVQGLKPDIVLVQEMNYGNNSEAAVRTLAEAMTDAGVFVFRESGAQIPNGIISRYRIVDAGVWDDPEVNNREWPWVQIDIPGDVDLYAISVHFLTASATVRNREATAMVSRVTANVPAGAYVVLGGDFNTDARTESAFSTLSSIFVTAAGPGGYPRDHDGNEGTNRNRSKPYDNVVVNSLLERWQVPTVLGNSVFPGGVVLDSRVYTPLSEVAPVLSGDSDSSNMQHMGVARDFRILY